MVYVLAITLLLIPVSAEAHIGQIPYYLFYDWRYWLFIGIYTLITVKLVLWARKAADIRDRDRKFPLQDVSIVATVILANAIVYQIFHHFEHLSQIFQFWYLGQYASISKGIIFFLDLEWNHFIFDMGYFLLLLWGIVLFIRKWKRAGHELGRAGALFLYGTLVVQGWHAVEHTYRIIWHVRTGCEPCSGIVDTLFDLRLITLHFWFNVFALTLPLLAFAYYRMDHKCTDIIRGLFGRRVSGTSSS